MNLLIDEKYLAMEITVQKNAKKIPKKWFRISNHAHSLCYSTDIFREKHNAIKHQKSSYETWMLLFIRSKTMSRIQLAILFLSLFHMNAGLTSSCPNCDHCYFDMDTITCESCATQCKGMSRENCNRFGCEKGRTRIHGRISRLRLGRCCLPG